MAINAPASEPPEPLGVPAANHHVDLTRRQIQIARYLPQGTTALEIAERLMLSEGTIRGHIRELIARTGVRNAQAVSAWAALHWDCCLHLRPTSD